jgi:putative transposase
VSAQDRQDAMKLIEQAVKNGARRTKACELLGISVKTLQRWEQLNGGEDRRRGPSNGPANRLSADERQQIISTATQEEFQDLPPSQIVPKLADRGIYIASESTFYRTLRAVKLNTPRSQKSNNKHSRPTPLIATGSNQVWSWDITYCRSIVRGMFFFLYMILDVWSRKIVGWAVHECESNELASLLIREAVCREGVDPNQLFLHSDNGSPMKGATMLATLQTLGVVPSFSRPSVSNDNPFSESTFSTMKTCPAYPDKPFESKEAVEDWVAEFVNWYNYEHLHSGIRFITPADRHHGNDRDILRHRQEVYRKAREENPSRWSGTTRDWTPIKEVYLNPEKLESVPAQPKQKSA